MTAGNCTVLAGTTSIVVTHNYGGVPPGVWVQPKDNLGARNWWIPDASINATTFTLYISFIDVGNHDFRWETAEPAMVLTGACTVLTANTSVTVTHGFGGAPTAIWVTPKDDLAGLDFYVDYGSITATQFTLYLTDLDFGADHAFAFFCNRLYTEGNATVPAGAESIVVNHGYPLGPGNVWVIPKQDMFGRGYWIDYASITLTQFTLYISSTDPATAFSFRFICGASTSITLGALIREYNITIAADGFHERKQIVTSEWDGWITTSSIAVRKVKILGCTRTWTLDCVEYGVDWVDSVVQAIQALVNDDSVNDFTVNLGVLHEVAAHVKVLSCTLAYPEGSHVGTRERSYTLQLQEVM